MERLKSLLPDLTFVLCIAIGLRLMWALYIPVIPVSDSAAYDVFALNMLQHGTYGWTADAPESYWAVGTSALYAVLYAAFGHNYWAIVGLNIALSTGIIYFTYRLVEIFFSDTSAPIVTAYLLALWPTGVIYVTVLASELPYMLFSLSGFFYFVKTPSILNRKTLYAAVLFAAAYYVRPVVTVAILMIAISCVLYLHQKLVSVLARYVCVMVVIATLVAPWAYRNYQLYADFVPNSSNGGSVFWMGNSPGTDGGYAVIPPEVKAQAKSSYEQSKILKNQAMEYIAAEPFAFVQRTAYKLYRFHSYETIGVSWNKEGITRRLGDRALMPLKLITQAYWLVLVGLAVVGLVIFWRKESLWRLLCNPFTLSWASTAGIHAIVVSQDRYHLPTVPFIAAFSAISLIAAYRAFQNRPSSTPAVDRSAATEHG